MGQLKYYSVIPNDKPTWLLRLQMEISRAVGIRGMDDNQADWRWLKDEMDGRIHELYMRRDISVRSRIETALVTGEGKTVLHIKRNNKVIQIYYIQK